MAAKKEDLGKELEQFKEYLRSESNEDARRPLLYPLFKRLYKDNFFIESDAYGADVYVKGQLIVEAKTYDKQWLEGFYQALHYQKRYGLAYTTVLVVANRFIGIWKVDQLPEEVVILSHTSDAAKAPSEIGKTNARKTQKPLERQIRDAAFYWLDPKMLDGDMFAGARNLTTESYEVLKILRNLDSNRIQINTHNFIDAIERLKPLFAHPIDAVHCFYAIVAYWDITSTMAQGDFEDEARIVGFKGQRFSEPIKIAPRNIPEFKKMVETHYIFTNEGSGLTADYYFSRFDEVMARIDPEYVKQHGIFFTDGNLSKFALWFVKNYYPEKLEENYIVFDPAGGSGNLVSSWKGKLKHKIISELQPDLLRTIERRMRIDPFHIETGFTIVPKTSENKGLNFLDIAAEEYINELRKELKRNNVELDKPFAFLLNPPYKNIKENVQNRDNTESNYTIEEGILKITGDEASQERYLAFLGQILNISILQNKQDNKLNPIVLIFTPTSWLIPRPAFIKFRETWDKHFKYEAGFIVTSNEFFKLEGKWPLSFTIWRFEENINQNEVLVYDLTRLKNIDLNINWNSQESEIYSLLKNIIKNSPKIILNKNKGTLREHFNLKLYDFIRTPSKAEQESKEIIGGLPITDERRKNNKTYGTPNSLQIGFMDNGTPVRIKPRGETKRFTSNNLLSLWFRLDTAFKDINKTKCFSGASDTRSYCAFDLESAKATFMWFAITKALNGNYPTWANQYDIWAPNITESLAPYWYSLCYAFALAENRCVVTKFEANNPVQGAPEVFVDNPLCPTHRDNFWINILDSEIVSIPNTALNLVNAVKELYRIFNLNYCKGQTIEHVGLHNEPYFRYFSYPDFLTPYSGLIQIRKFAEIHGHEDLLNQFTVISQLTKKVKAELYRLLTEEFKYFE